MLTELRLICLPTNESLLSHEEQPSTDVVEVCLNRIQQKQSETTNLEPATSSAITRENGQAKKQIKKSDTTTKNKSPPEESNGFAIPKNLNRLPFKVRTHTRRSLTPDGVTDQIQKMLTVSDSSHIRVTRTRSGRLNVSRKLSPDFDERSGATEDDENTRVRPRSERAKRMEQKKLEKERLENEMAEQEEQEREERRLRRQKGSNESKARHDGKSSLNSSHSDISSEDARVIQNLEAITKKSYSPEEVSKLLLAIPKRSTNDEGVVSAKASPVGTATQPHQGWCIQCFFCGEFIHGAEPFLAHCTDHLEQFNYCPICIIGEKSARKKTPLRHVLHLFDHLIESHFKKDKNTLRCPFCPCEFDLIKKNEDIRTVMYRTFRHVIYQCPAAPHCLLCLASDCLEKPNTYEHRQTEHPAIFNRYYCATCLRSQSTKFEFSEHVCSYSFRCSCNMNISYRNKNALDDHLNNATDHSLHQRIYPVSDVPLPFVPGPQKKYLSSVMSSLNRITKPVPQLTDMYQFMNKYKFHAEPLVDDPLEDLPPPPELIPGDAPSTSRPLSKPPVLTRETNDPLSPSQTPPPVPSPPKPKKSKSKKKKPEDTLKTVEIQRVLPEKSDVWGLLEKFKLPEEYNEIADIVEDLVFTIADTPTAMANGIGSEKDIEDEENCVSPPPILTNALTNVAAKRKLDSPPAIEPVKLQRLTYVPGVPQPVIVRLGSGKYEYQPEYRTYPRLF